MNTSLLPVLLLILTGCSNSDRVVNNPTCVIGCGTVTVTTDIVKYPPPKPRPKPKP